MVHHENVVMKMTKMTTKMLVAMKRSWSHLSKCWRHLQRRSSQTFFQIILDRANCNKVAWGCHDFFSAAGTLSSAESNCESCPSQADISVWIRSNLKTRDKIGGLVDTGTRGQNYIYKDKGQYKEKDKDTGTKNYSNFSWPLLGVSKSSEFSHDGQGNLAHFLEHLHGVLQFSYLGPTVGDFANFFVLFTALKGSSISISNCNLSIEITWRTPSPSQSPNDPPTWKQTKSCFHFGGDSVSLDIALSVSEWLLWK